MTATLAARVACGLALAAVLAGCTTSLRPLPTAITSVNGTRILCAGGGYAEKVTLHGSPADPALTWVYMHRSATRRNVVWPPGYHARFNPQLEVLDEHGRVVAGEGRLVRGGCPMPPDGEMIEL